MAKYRKLGRTSDQRKALLRNQVTALIQRGKIVTTEAGDIVLYSGNQIVVFYGSNSWAYTRLGHIVDKTAEEMAELLSGGDVTVTISMGE